MRMAGVVSSVVLASVLGFGGAGCSGGNATAGGVGAAKVDVSASKFVDHRGESTVDVDSRDNDFDEPYITVSAGTKVTWTNDGRIAHNVVPVNEGAFTGISQADFGPGQTHSFTFHSTGDYPYFCSIHGTRKLHGMAGVIRVVAKK